MASISREKNGRRTIQFVAPNGKRKSIRLGKTPQRTAEAVKIKVEQLVASKIAGHAVDDETARWIASLDSVMSDKLAAAGLIPRRETIALLGFIDLYMASRIDLKPRTQMKLTTTRRVLVELFRADRPMRDISPGDADEFRLHLVSRGLSENTIRKHVSIAKQFFNAAVRKRLISSNPFAGLKSTVQPNPSRYYFVTGEEAQRVMDSCPDAQWRLIFALSRYGGLRCPSEHLNLRWEDVDWERGRITVNSPKTEHHVGGESRVIPIFPELRSYLEEAFEQAEEGTEFIITRYRDTNSNLRTQLQRIIKRAGLKSWPKLFQNL